MDNNITIRKINGLKDLFKKKDKSLGLQFGLPDGYDKDYLIEECDTSVSRHQNHHL